MNLSLSVFLIFLAAKSAMTVCATPLASNLGHVLHVRTLNTDEQLPPTSMPWWFFELTLVILGTQKKVVPPPPVDVTPNNDLLRTNAQIDNDDQYDHNARIQNGSGDSEDFFGLDDFGS
ncbi:hypothetical protein FRB96_006506 [Tulasnella sp. 330]|nr:hypothetical protein FRB96_006506 [Tulasnella sp. 330]